jgi:hypothetical protein
MSYIKAFAIAGSVLCIISSVAGCGTYKAAIISGNSSPGQLVVPKNACSLLATPPEPAASYGFSLLAFCDDFDSINTIDVNGTGGAGFKWYTNRPFGSGQTEPQAYSVSQSVLTVTSTGQTANWGLSTRDPVTGNGESWRFGYFEARISFDPEPPPQSIGWPSFWGISASKIQNPGISQYAELDFFEAGNNPGIPDNWVQGTLHDWQSDMSVNYWNSNSYQQTHTDWSQWHIVGVLWAPGIVTWYLDGNPLMNQQYWSARQPSPLAVTVNGISPTPPGTFSDLDLDALGQQIVVGSDPNWPMHIDWVRVWHN